MPFLIQTTPANIECHGQIHPKGFYPHTAELPLQYHECSAAPLYSVQVILQTTKVTAHVCWIPVLSGLMAVLEVVCEVKSSTTTTSDVNSHKSSVTWQPLSSWIFSTMLNIFNSSPRVVVRNSGNPEMNRINFSVIRHHHNFHILSVLLDTEAQLLSWLEIIGSQYMNVTTASTRCVMCTDGLQQQPRHLILTRFFCTYKLFPDFNCTKPEVDDAVLLN